MYAVIVCDVFLLSSLSRLSCRCFHVLIKGFPFAVFLLLSHFFHFAFFTLISTSMHLCIITNTNMVLFWCLIFSASPLFFISHLSFLESSSLFIFCFHLTVFHSSISFCVSLSHTRLSVIAVSNYSLAVKWLWCGTKAVMVMFRGFL